MQKSDLTELEIELQDLKLRMARPGGGKISYEQVVHQPQPIPAPIQVEKPQSKVADEQGIEIFKSPMVGTFYSKPSPEDPPFVTVGQNVKKGDTLCLIEVMKLFTTVECTADGTVETIFVEDGALVEFDQPLFLIA